MQDCNLVMYNANLTQLGQSPNAAVWSSGTYYAGPTPCVANVSSAAGGSLTVSDANGVRLFKAP